MSKLKKCSVKLLPLCDITLCPGEFEMSNFLSKTIKFSEEDKKLSNPVSNARKTEQQKRSIDEDEEEVENESENSGNELDYISDTKENWTETKDGQSLNYIRNSSDYEKMIQKNREEKMAFLKTLKIDEVKEEFKEISTRLIKKSQPVNKKKSQPVRKVYREHKRPKITEFTPVRKSRRLLKLPEEKVEKVYAKNVKEASGQLEPERKVLPAKYSFEEAVDFKEDFDDFVNKFEFKAEPDQKFNCDYVSNFKQMELRESNIAKVVPKRISAIAVHPSTTNIIVMAGSKYGHLGFWNVMSDSVPVLFSPHMALISNLKVNPDNNFQIISSSYDGTLRSCDVEKKVFDEIYNVSEETECTYFDFISKSTLLVSQKNGNVSVIDVRSGSLKSEKKHECHDRTVKTVSVHPVNKNLFLTTDNKGLLKLWDLRMLLPEPKLQLLKLWDLRKLQKKSIINIHFHKRSVSSAFFSPVTGNSVLTTSLDDSICLFDSTNVEKEILFKKSIKHNNWTGRWLTPFKATWLPNSEEAFVVGSMRYPRQIEIFNGKGTDNFTFIDENLSSITSLNEFHPSLNVLAGGNSSGKVFVFMDRDLKF